MVKSIHTELPPEALSEMRRDIDTNPLLVASKKSLYNEELLISYKQKENKHNGN